MNTLPFRQCRLLSTTAQTLTRVPIIRQPKPSPIPEPISLSQPMYKVTLHRSTIGLPERLKKCARALGLRKRTQTIYAPQTQRAAGLILKIKEIVKVENVTHITPTHRGHKGYEIVSRANAGEQQL